MSETVICWPWGAKLLSKQDITFTGDKNNCDLYGSNYLAKFDFIKIEIKTSSSKWLKTQDKTLKLFQFQAGYGAFSISTNSDKDGEEVY